MKVFAVTTSLALKSWPSRAAFEAEHGYLDECFLKVATTKDYQTGWYNTPQVYLSPDKPLPPGVEFRVVQDEQEVKAHNIIHEALRAHFKGKTFPINHGKDWYE